MFYVFSGLALASANCFTYLGPLALASANGCTSYVILALAEHSSVIDIGSFSAKNKFPLTTMSAILNVLVANCIFFFFLSKKQAPGNPESFLYLHVKEFVEILNYPLYFFFFF